MPGNYWPPTGFSLAHTLLRGNGEDEQELVSVRSVGWNRPDGALLTGCPEYGRRTVNAPRDYLERPPHVAPTSAPQPNAANSASVDAGAGQNGTPRTLTVSFDTSRKLCPVCKTIPEPGPTLPEIAAGNGV